MTPEPTATGTQSDAKPSANFSDSVFNQYEVYNIALIRDYENRVYGGSYY